MKVSITYDDTLYQLVPKEPITKLLARYEEMRQWCMRMGNRHPDSILCCHKALGSYGTPTEHGMALLLDDMALALSAAPTPPAQPEDVRVPLTDDEIWKFWWARPEVPDGEDDSMEAEFVAACRRVLAAHGITAAAPKQPEAGRVPEGYVLARKIAELNRKLREPEWHIQSIREFQRELKDLEEQALAAAPKQEPGA